VIGGDLAAGVLAHAESLLFGSGVCQRHLGEHGDELLGARPGARGGLG
jgi:hypothetical protein